MGEVRILFLGDIVGRPGLRSLFAGFSSLKKETAANVVAVNGENVADGFGLTPKDADRLFALGIDVISSGNHIWQRDDVFPALDNESRLLRPLNYPASAPGHGSTVVSKAGIDIGFINVLGQIRMGMTVDCPFKTVKKALADMRKRTKCIIVDFHAEDVREKEGMFHHIDGQVSAVVGTHTHVATADERILPGGTAVVTDLGMCGPADSVIGTTPDLSIRRALTQLPLRMEVLEAEAEIRGVLITVDSESGKALGIERIHRRAEGLQP